MNLESKDEKKLDYEISIKKKGDSFNLFIRELKIFGKGKTLDEAYNNLLNKKEELVQEYEELGILDELPEPSPRRVSGPLGDPGGILKFFTKTLVVAVVAFVMLGFVVKDLKKQGESFKNDIFQVGEVFKNEVHKIKTLKVGSLLGRELQKAANNEITPEKQEAIIKNVRVLVRRYKPILDELNPLFARDINKQ